MLVLFPLVLLLLLPVIWCCYLARALGIPQWREGALGMQWPKPGSGTMEQNIMNSSG